MKFRIREYDDHPGDSSTTPDESHHTEYILSTTNDNQIASTMTNKSRYFYQSLNITKVLSDLFLPIGFPNSVDKSYLPYQLYDGLQGLCSYWRGVVSTKAVLEASGVGNADATAFSAAIQWALRDGTGMIGGLVFSYGCSSYFDTHVKEFRLFADVINDVALTLDMFAPLAPSEYSLYILSLSTICKTLCGMSAGATKGRITHHFARHNGNMADLTAKESTQETLVSLLGMIGGVYVARWLENAPSNITWWIFWFLTAVHVWANYKGVMIIKLATLNPERTEGLFRDIIQTLVDNHEGEKDIDEKKLQAVVQEAPSPDTVSESLFHSTWTLLFPRVVVSKPLVLKYLDCIQAFQQESYILGYGGGRRIYVWLGVDAKKRDRLQAYIHAMLIRELLDQGKEWNMELVQRSLVHIKQLFYVKHPLGGQSKYSLLSWLDDKGWDFHSRLYLGYSDARIEWSSIKED
mmetsp:Transcript_7247/g.17038  ORF Transcript_7247/g.17038 Transcript_7247/m.17038 type:complete len:463 (+) Transcript_7247:146-1534(+)